MFNLTVVSQFWFYLSHLLQLPPLIHSFTPVHWNAAYTCVLENTLLPPLDSLNTHNSFLSPLPSILSSDLKPIYCNDCHIYISCSDIFPKWTVQQPPAHLHLDEKLPELTCPEPNSWDHISAKLAFSSFFFPVWYMQTISSPVAHAKNIRIFFNFLFLFPFAAPHAISRQILWVLFTKKYFHPNHHSASLHSIASVHCVSI